MIRLFLLNVDVFPSAIVLLPILLLLDKTYFQTDPCFNLVPFLDMIYDFKNVILNIILFIPLGIIMPLLWERFRIFRISFLFGVGMSFIIEFLQLFTFRTTDINDILTNSAGTVLGYFILNIIIQKVPKSSNFRYPEHDICLLCSLIFIIMFFIEPFISSAIWSMVL